MHSPNPVTALIAEFLALSDISPRRRTDDEERSLLHARIDADLAAGSTPAGGNSTMVRWIISARALDAFTDRERRLPRENNRLPRGLITAEERQLHEWIRNQRRETTRNAHATYQTRRLELVPGWSWGPLEDLWSEKFAAYRAFLNGHGFAPRARSDDAAERSLAHWAAKQRFKYRRGTLAANRVVALNSLSIWGWPTLR